jgi:hypothetical protein
MPQVIAVTVTAAVFILAGGLYLTWSVNPAEVPSPPVEAPVETASPPVPAPSGTVSPPVPVPSGPASPPVTPPSGQIPAVPSQPHQEDKTPLTFDQKIEGLRQAIDQVCATGRSQEVILVFSEAEANEQAEKLLATTAIETDIPLEVTGVKIYFEDDDRVKAEIKAVIYVFKPTIKAETRVGIRDGEPEIEITRLSFGFLPLPGLKDKVEQIIMQNIDELKTRYSGGQMGCEGRINFEFTDITISQGEATVTLTVRRS